MILADNGVALEFEQSADAVADNRASQMADVHLLGDIRAGKIHDNVFWAWTFLYSKICRSNLN